jgi:3-phenylpropionate/cinnamic acid dioxygenase small subunit
MSGQGTVSAEAQASPLGGGDRQRAEEFLFHEARLLDEGRFRAWADLFTDDGTYWVPAAWGQQEPTRGLSIFYDDRQLIDIRVRRLEHPRAHAQNPPARTVHQISNVHIVENDEQDDLLSVKSTLILVVYRLKEQRVYAGLVHHRLCDLSGQLKIAFKRVDLMDCDGPLPPIYVPF